MRPYAAPGRSLLVYVPPPAGRDPLDQWPRRPWEWPRRDVGLPRYSWPLVHGALCLRLR